MLVKLSDGSPGHARTQANLGRRQAEFRLVSGLIGQAAHSERCLAHAVPEGTTPSRWIVRAACAAISEFAASKRNAASTPPAREARGGRHRVADRQAASSPYA